MNRYICVVCVLLGAVSAFWGVFGGTAFSTSPKPVEFVDVKEVCPSVVLDIRYATPHNFVGTPVEGYGAAKCLLTRPAAEALARVQQDLKPFSLSLKVYDCYRPQSAVDHFVRWAEDAKDTKMMREFYPTVDKRNLFRDGYIAKRSGHSRGSTVDLTIVPVPVPPQETYRERQPLLECFFPAGARFGDNSIDMGSGFDCFHDISHTATDRIGWQQRANRLLLKTLMERHGFRNYALEWWHYTLKDEPYPDRYFDLPLE